MASQKGSSDAVHAYRVARARGGLPARRTGSVSADRIASIILALLAALGAGTGAHQSGERAASQAQASACGESIVALANALAAQHVEGDDE